MGDNVSSAVDVLCGPNVGTNFEIDDMSLVCYGTAAVVNVDYSNRVHHAFDVTRASDDYLIESSTAAALVENGNNRCVLREKDVATPTI